MKTPGNPLFCPDSNNAYALSGLYLGCVFGPKGQKISLFADIGKSQSKRMVILQNRLIKVIVSPKMPTKNLKDFCPTI